MRHKCVYLFDVDNTLFDSDKFIADFHAFLLELLGEHCSSEYWAIYNRIRKKMGYADYLGALQHYRSININNQRLLSVSTYLLNYPFADHFYTNAIKVLQRFQRFGPTIILTDGDAILQPHKIHRSGLWQAVDGQVLIYIHKEKMLADIAQRFPADHYVMVDDKLRILTAMKAQWRTRLTTVWPKQGHYAHDLTQTTLYPAADITVKAIDELMVMDPATLLIRF